MNESVRRAEWVSWGFDPRANTRNGLAAFAGRGPTCRHSMNVQFHVWATLCMAAASVTAQEPRFRTLTIDTNIAIGYGLAVSDVNGDRKTDIVLCDAREIAWYQNPTWAKHVIATNLTRLDHVCVAAADIDGDGRAEIAVGAGWNPGDTVNSGALFFLRAPADRTRLWEPVPLPHEPTMHRIRWAKGADGRMALFSVPLHGRGNKDAQGDGVRIQRYTPANDPSRPWTVDTLNAGLHKTHNFDPVPWAGSDGTALLVGAKEGLFVLRQTQAGQPPNAEQLGSDDDGGVGEVRLGRGAAGTRFIAGVSPMHGNQLVVFRPPASGSGLWTRTVLTEGLQDGHALVCADFLGTGSDQIAVGWRAMNRPRSVKVGVKLFIPAGEAWREVLIDDDGMACEDLAFADLDGDGRSDLIASGRATKNVKIYFNESVK
jgi:hypothetical protein